ncbi:Peroxisome size and maintenance regulator [Coemansia erecta]|nr:Peroxisome size and maintenance regulator [Coemansia erecta]
MHDYRPTTFVSPTYCELCSGFLWGLAKQGVQCYKCRKAAHKSCAFDATTTTQCLGDRGLATLLTTTNNNSESTISNNNSDDEDKRDSEYIQRLDNMFWQQVAEETKTNSRVSMQTEQPLSLFQTLPANFMQFTAKLAPLHLLHRGITEIVFWRRPQRTVAAMLVYSMYCLRPNLLLATPLALMIAYIVFNYYNRAYGRTENTEGLGIGVQTLPRRLGSGLFGIVSSGPSGQSEPGQLRGRLRERRRGSQPNPNNPYPQISTAKSSRNVMLQQGGPVGSHDEALPPLRMSADAGQSFAEQRRRSSSSAALMNGHADSRAQTPTHAGSAPTSLKPRVLVRTPSSSESAASQSALVDLGALLGVAGFGSTRYTENVHTTQIMTGTYVSLYDWVVAHNCMVDWSDPQMARHILELCICAQIALLVVVYWVPWYLLFLAGGNLGLLAMSPHVRAFFKVFGIEFALYVHEWVMVRWNYLKYHVSGILVVRWMRAVLRWRRQRRQDTYRTLQFESPGLLAQDSDDDCDDAHKSGYMTPPSLLSLSSTGGSSTSFLVRQTQMVSVFENQRWWLGFGWIPRLGSNERAKWSDETGKRRFASICDFMPGDGYEWADTDNNSIVKGGGGWEIDRHWALPAHCTDEDGWLYTDNFWRRPVAAPSAMSSYTRRRRWIRRVRPASTTNRIRSGTQL